MPILQIHLAEGHPTDVISELALKCSATYAEIMNAPIERVRVFVNEYPKTHVAAGGELASNGAMDAPFFSALALEGRPIEDRQAVLARITDVIVDVLHVDREWVRGMVHVVHPENWGIAGVPASEARKSEIEARAEAATLSES